MGATPQSEREAVMPKEIWTYLWWCPYCGHSENLEGRVCGNPKCMRPESALSKRAPISFYVTDKQQSKLQPLPVTNVTQGPIPRVIVPEV
jgi:hypothetical protein